MRKKLEFYRQLITVRGTGEFPFDMLRRDFAVPAREQDAAQMSPDLDRTIEREVRLIRFIHKDWTDKRPGQGWAVFGWPVIEEQDWS
jgi:hypothetical protein